MRQVVRKEVMVVKKKILSLVLGVCMSTMLFSGCGSTGTSQPVSPAAEPAKEEQAPEQAEDFAATEAAQTEDAESTEPVYISPNAAEMTGSVRLMTAFNGKVGTDDLIAEFNSYYPNIEVTYEVYTNNADGNLSTNTALQAGNCDVLLSFGTDSTAFRWENGMLMDITDRLQADHLDLVKEWGTDAYKYNDRVYCIPSGGLSIFVAINMDMWNQAGLGEIPDAWTWDEYIDACRKMTKRDDSGAVTVYGGMDFQNLNYDAYPLRQTKGVDAFYKADHTADFDNPLIANFLNKELAAEEEGVWCSKAQLISNNQKSRDLVLTGEGASCVESIITRFLADKENYPHDFILGYAPYPINEAGETNYCLGNMPNSMYCVSSNAQDPDAAYEFAKFASTYGGKWLYKAGHTTTWTGVDPDELVDVVFGSREEAEQLVDVDSYIKNVVAVGQPAYYEEFIVGYNQIETLMEEYVSYILNGTMSVEEGLASLNQEVNDVINDAQ